MLCCTVLDPGLVSHHVRFNATHFRHLVREFVREWFASSCADGAPSNPRLALCRSRGCWPWFGPVSRDLFLPEQNLSQFSKVPSNRRLAPHPDLVESLEAVS